MRLHSGGFSEAETEDYRMQIFYSLIHGLKDVLDSLSYFSTALSPENSWNEDLLASAQDVKYDVAFPVYLREPLQKLWEDPACEAWKKQNNDPQKCASVMQFFSSTTDNPII